MGKHTTRRGLLTLVSGSVIGLAGCLSGLTGNQDATAAARMFNNAYETYKAAEDTRQDAKDAWDVENWNEASDLYGQAQNLYQRAESDFEDAADRALDANCRAIREDSRDMSQKSQYMAEACRNWKKAATLYGQDDREQANGFRVDGNNAYDRATNYAALPEKDPDNPTC